jgi:hypothetical protein
MRMNRRDFLHTSGALALTAAVMKAAEARVRVLNWDKYDFRSGPPVKDGSIRDPFRNTHPMPASPMMTWS